VNPFKIVCLTALMLLGLVACGTTLEKQENRFKKNTDTLEAVAAKQPKMASAIKAKLKGFSTERETIVKAGGEDAKTKLATPVTTGKLGAKPAGKLGAGSQPAGKLGTKPAGKLGGAGSQPAKPAAGSQPVKPGTR
jgi:hypothetical protein